VGQGGRQVLYCAEPADYDIVSEMKANVEDDVVGTLKQVE